MAPLGAHDGIIFDLDGTLWDSTETIAYAWNSALAALGLPELRTRIVTARDIASICGLPFDDCVRTLFPAVAGKDFRKLADALNENEEKIVATRGGRLYPGVAEGIPKLARLRKLYIVSNCQAWYLDTFLQLSGLAEHFQDSTCHGKSGKDKAENIATIVRANSIARPLYVGDTARDFAATRAAGCDFAFAAYGFGALTREDESRAAGSYSDFPSLFADLLAGGLQ